MLKYIIKRIIGVIPTLIIVTTFVFFFVRLIPGDPARLVAGPQGYAGGCRSSERGAGIK